LVQVNKLGLSFQALMSFSRAGTMVDCGATPTIR